jgi:hypothetical protein
VRTLLARLGLRSKLSRKDDHQLTKKVVQEEAFKRLVDLCKRFGLAHSFTIETESDGSRYYSGTIGQFCVWIYEDGALISDNEIPHKTDMRYELPDYSDVEQLFRIFIRDFFHICLNGPFNT